jgi:hypothetical protein
MKIGIIILFFCLAFSIRSAYGQKTEEKPVIYSSVISKRQLKKIKALLEPTLTFLKGDNGIAIRFLLDSTVLISPVKLPFKYNWELDFSFPGRYIMTEHKNSTFRLKAQIHSTNTMGMCNFFEFIIIIQKKFLVFYRKDKLNKRIKIRRNT